MRLALTLVVLSIVGLSKAGIVLYQHQHKDAATEGEKTKERIIRENQGDKKNP